MNKKATLLHCARHVSAGRRKCFSVKHCSSLVWRRVNVKQKKTIKNKHFNSNVNHCFDLINYVFTENNTLSESNPTATDSSDLSLSLSSPRVERPSEDPEPIKCQSSKSQSSLTSSMKLSNEWDSSTVVKKSKAPV